MGTIRRMAHWMGISVHDHKLLFKVKHQTSHAYVTLWSHLVVNYIILMIVG
jgi:hypothetical protein